MNSQALKLRRGYPSRPVALVFLGKGILGSHVGQKNLDRGPLQPQTAKKTFAAQTDDSRNEQHEKSALRDSRRWWRCGDRIFQEMAVIKLFFVL